MDKTIKHDIAFLDFLRGWAAVLVFFHHASILGGGPAFLSGVLGQEAVNAFMLASGFLIYFQCNASKIYAKLQTMDGIKNFYIRRFFRIAPAYYLCLVLAILLASKLGGCREIIAGILPNTATSMERYYIDSPIKSFLLHISFVFGLIPSYAYSTPLPDWSLGLEMQFYLLFPVILFFLRKNFTLSLVTLSIAMMATWLIFNKIGLKYPMPTLLPLKFHNFAAGIALAHLLLNKAQAKKYYFLVAILAALLLLGNRTPYMSLLFMFGWWWLCIADSGRNIFHTKIQELFSHGSSKFLSEMSYSIYIFHLILMLPFFAWVLQWNKPGTGLWLILSCSLLAVVMGIAHLIYRWIELPGIALGKKIIEHQAKRNNAVESHGEQGARSLLSRTEKVRD